MNSTTVSAELVVPTIHLDPLEAMYEELSRDSQQYAHALTTLRKKKVVPAAQALEPELRFIRSTAYFRAISNLRESPKHMEALFKGGLVSKLCEVSI